MPMTKSEAFLLVQQQRKALYDLANDRGIIQENRWLGLIAFCKDNGLISNAESLEARLDAYKKTCEIV